MTYTRYQQNLVQHVSKDPMTDANRVQRTLLVVEDEVLLLLEMRDHLQQAGYRVIEAHDGDQARAILESGISVDLVCTDVRMPGLNGIGLARWIQAQHNGVPVIAVSGEVSLGEIPAVADAKISKPIDYHKLIERIDSLLAHLRVKN